MAPRFPQFTSSDRLLTLKRDQAGHHPWVDAALQPVPNLGELPATSRTASS